MARRPNPVPTYRRRKQSGQAVVTLRIADGRRKDVLLGRYNSPESKVEYRRLIAELEHRPAGAVAGPGTADLTMNELLLAFARHAERHYRRPDGSQTNEVVEYKLTLRPVKALYGRAPARKFGPLALKAVRAELVKSGLCRSLVNQRVARLGRVFKWAAGEELIPFDVYQRLTAVAGLQKGRCGVREAEPVEPVAESAVRATLRYVRPAVAAMIELQLATGMRPGEVCRVRPREIDRSGSVWVFRPEQHKTAWRGKSRSVAIGPKGQAVLHANWPVDPNVYFFSPRRSVAEQHTERSDKRLTPRYPSHVARNSQKRVAAPTRPPAELYSPASYGKAIARGVRKANERRERMAGRGNYDLVQHWHPNQLRHTAGPDVRKRYGLEAAQAFLGHQRADVTQVYAERNESLAAKVAAEVG
jgi:integrase